MTSPTKAPPHLRTGRGLPACTKHPTDGGYYRRFSARAHPRPIPLVEPVTTAVLPFRILNSLSFVCCMPSYSTDQTHLAGFEETSAWLSEVVVRDRAQPER